MTAIGHAIIVTFNSAGHLPDLLADLAPAAEPGELIVTAVDNGSSDQTRAILAATGWVRLLTAPDNPGYAAAINIARAAATGLPAGLPLLILNPDVRIGVDEVRALLAGLARPGTGITVPTVTEPDGQTYPSLRREPSLLRALGDAVLGARAGHRPPQFSEMVRQTETYPDLDEVDWATGAVLAISPECDRAVGDWDSARFFMYSEETDYCRRARAAGFAVRHVPAATVVHEGGGSGGSPHLQALMAVNRVRYYRKHHGRPAAAVFRLLVILHALARLHQRGQRRALEVLCLPSRSVSLPGGRAGL